MPLIAFSQIVIERLKYYVYLYINPLDNTIFYVGKGKGNRAFAHLFDLSETKKVETIRQIRQQGLEPRIEILVHGLDDEETALRIEAAVIDLLGTKHLTNLVRGWDSSIVGRMSVEQLAALYDKTPGIIIEPVLLIRINKLYRYGMSELELYEVTRGVWKVGTRRSYATFAVAVYRGIVREVYAIKSWHRAGTTPYQTRLHAHVVDEERWEFIGAPAPQEIREKYIDKSVDAYFAQNSQNPIKYVNC
jgi:hypothetical protein